MLCDGKHVGGDPERSPTSGEMYACLASFKTSYLYADINFLTVFDIVKNSLGIVSVPLEGLISVLYWGLRAYDPKLLVPPDPRYQIPLVMDLSLYVFIGGSLVIPLPRKLIPITADTRCQPCSCGSISCFCRLHSQQPRNPFYSRVSSNMHLAACSMPNINSDCP